MRNQMTAYIAAVALALAGVFYLGYNAGQADQASQDYFQGTRVKVSGAAEDDISCANCQIERVGTSLEIISSK